MSDFLMWRTDLQPQFCVLTDVRNVPDPWELGLGVPRAAGFAPDAFFEMDPQFPKALVLPDNASNLTDLVVVSTPVKEILERAAPPTVEFLQVRIQNHKGRTAAEAYWIVNPVGSIDCIDVDQSEIVWNALEPTEISSCMRLVIDEDRIEPGTQMFRAKHLPYEVFVHRALAEELEGSGATGIRFLQIDEYPE